MVAAPGADEDALGAAVADVVEGMMENPGARRPSQENPDILYEAQGIRIRRNRHNRFVVVRLHYSADPVKRAPAWIKEATYGMSPAKARQEYEIDYSAPFGEKVFPQITKYREKIVLRPPYAPVEEWERVFGSFDYGTRNPSAFHVHRFRKNSDGELALETVWELYKPMKDLAGFAEEMKECPYFEQLVWIAGDPHSLFEKTQTSALGGMESLAIQFARHGVRNIVPSSTKEETWVTLMHTHWGRLEERDATYKIRDCCPALISEFENAVYAKMSPQAMREKNWKERIADRRNHGMDGVKYLMNAHPRWRERVEQPAHPRERARPGKRKPLWRRYLT